jgi:NhaD family Na+/H+ antiporter
MISYILIVVIFALGYLAIILEHPLKVSKSAIALLMAVSCWAVFFIGHSHEGAVNLSHLQDNLASVAQIVFFLIGAMVIVELIDSHHGFKLITDAIRTTSQRKILWMTALIAFFLSAILDNLTTTILMISLLRKLIPVQKERFLFGCLIVIAANAGGAWTPIGDITTTMLWIEGQISSMAVIKALFAPSLVSLLVPLIYFTFRVKGKIPLPEKQLETKEEPGARIVLILGVASLVAVPIIKAVTGLPPFMGILINLSLLWILTDGLHQIEERRHLRVPHILAKIDLSGVLFFLGILLAVGALESAHLLSDLALWIGSHIQSLPLIATLIGALSAIIDNVPLVAATMGMYPIDQFPQDHTLWHMIAYAAGTGGSMLIIGSAAGVAFMGMEKVDFISYMKKVTLPTLAGYLAGMGVYLAYSG